MNDAIKLPVTADGLGIYGADGIRVGTCLIAASLNGQPVAAARVNDEVVAGLVAVAKRMGSLCVCVGENVCISCASRDAVDAYEAAKPAAGGQE